MGIGELVKMPVEIKQLVSYQLLQVTAIEHLPIGLQPKWIRKQFCK